MTQKLVLLAEEAQRQFCVKNNTYTNNKARSTIMDYTEMLFAFNVHEKAMHKRSRHLFRTPEPQRDAEEKTYTLQMAVNEVLAETRKIALMIRTSPY